ncbi:MAG: exodeoxyribonuclease III [bacterium]|nr:exodeoxyribonuclease III [bacterium]
MAKTIEILSWNVNGLRAVERKGFIKWLLKRNPDILGIQELKAQKDQLSVFLKQVDGYEAFFNPAQRPGYSGVALYTRLKPKKILEGIGIERFDKEGRVIIAEFDGFDLYNVYFPNGKMSLERLKFKMDFYDAFLKHVKSEQGKGKKVIFCGDVNTAHEEIDLARPKANEKISGFLREERDWIDKVVKEGFVDTFRKFHPDKKDQYSWWSQRSGARARNVGWRIDYFFVEKALEKRVKDAFILQGVEGSDHAPVGIKLEV